MKKLAVVNMVTLDGYFEGANRDISWHNVDEEVKEFANAQLDSVDVILFGRVSYEMMANYWPTEMALKNDPVTAAAMNSKAKLVFSRTLSNVTWQNTRLVKDNIEQEVIKLKAQPGRDLIIGSSDLSVSLMAHGLIDEFRIMLNPVALGEGKSLFKGLQKRLNLELFNTRTFKSGNILLYYRPKGKSS